MATLLALTCSVLIAPGPAAAQVTADLQSGHTRTEVGLGLGVQNALLTFSGRQYETLPPDMRLETGLDAVPQASLIIRHWLSRWLGLRLTGTMGYLPELVIPEAQANKINGHETRLFVMTRQVQADLIYRHHFSSSPSSPALQAELGFELLGYWVQEVEPPVLVSTAYVGPTAKLAFHMPLGADLGVTVGAIGFMPLYVYEEPEDSGRRDSSFAWGGELSAEYRLNEALALELALRRVAVSTTFRDHGSRGISGHGVYQAQSDDTFHQLGLNLHYRL